MLEPNALPTHTLGELCTLVDLPLRTIRYYVQIGLVDKPDGETRAARYGPRHLEQLLTVKKWSAAGLPLERIRALLHGELPQAAPLPSPAPGALTVRSHLVVAPGIELVIEPGAAGLSPEQLRQFARGVLQLHTELLSAAAANNPT